MHATSANPAPDCYIGLMSGTSMDGIDGAMVEFPAEGGARLLSTFSLPYEAPLRAALEAMVQPNWSGTLSEIAALDHQVGLAFANAAVALLDQSPDHSVAAIGSHGQTVFHNPEGQFPSSWQLGDPNLIAEATGISVVADFRRRDMANGGQGAPLVPAFLQYVFEDSPSALVNLGGIANLTLIPGKSASVVGFDTGPANTLMDNWIRQHKNLPFDNDGEWSRMGECSHELLAAFLTEPYFQRPFPKSTGREHFNLEWVNRFLGQLTYTPTPADVQATLCELTAITISQSLTTGFDQLQCKDLVLCGGGARNSYLVERLTYHLPSYRLQTSDNFGIDADYLEAQAFAWLARQSLERKPGNIPSVTGSAEHRQLGGIYFA